MCTIALAACGKTLNATQIEATIRDDIVKQGGTSLQSVICPTNIKPAAGEMFECVGVLESGNGMAIAVQQQDAQGNIAWDFSSVKGLLNMPKLQASVEERLQREVGLSTVDCGGSIYRPVKPGEIFECKLLKRNPASTSKTVQLSSTLPKSQAKTNDQATSSKNQAVNQPDTIQVTIAPSGDINWQRIVQVQIAQSPASSGSPTSSAQLTSKPNAPTQLSSEKAASTAPSTGKSAEEFLNQPGATDDFE